MPPPLTENPNLGAVDAAPLSARRRPGRPKGGQIGLDRDTLITAATGAIERLGPDVTLDEIAAEAGVTKPVLYRIIGDRAALTAALSESLVQRINAAVDVEFDADASAEVALGKVVSSYLSVAAAERHLFLFVNASGADVDDTRTLIDQSAALMFESFSAVHAAGIGTADVARTWSYGIVGAFQVITLMWLRDEYAPIEHVAQDLAALLWPAIDRLTPDN